MRLTFWGTRGSIAVPGPDTVEYGGNTTCIEIACPDGGPDAGPVILDAGTGIRALGLSLARSMPVRCAIFLTHTHWDHIQGLPFFVPLFVPGNTVDIHGTFDPIAMKDLRAVLDAQMDYNYFPVRAGELKADIRCQSLAEGQTVTHGAARITPFLVNHTVITFGYKVECGGRAVFFTGDHERWANIYGPDDAFFEEYQAIIDEKRGELAAFLRGVDVLVADGQYTREEFPAKAGWGHSSLDMCVDLALEAGIPRLFITHHEPTRSDAALSALLADLRARRGGEGVDLALAREGTTVEV